MERSGNTPGASDGPIEMGGVVVHPGARIASYVFIREVGSGGMARVLLARDPSGALVALKVLRPNRFKTGVVRFRREFRALSRIDHPNVIRVEAYGDIYGHPYIAMEYVEGPDLHTVIRGFRGWEPTRRWRRVEEILVDLCRALAAIHRRGLVHRDLKPSNVLLTTDGVCKLTDFGIVKDLDPSSDPHVSTTLVGTWAYASPEQITGGAIDHRSDLYSLGVILFAMLTGKRPFVANDLAGYLALHRDRPAPAPRDVVRDVPAHLDEICRRLLAKSPRDRFQSAQEILYRLEAEEREEVPTTSAWEPPLVGRALEVDALSDAVARLTRSEGGFVALEGDSGSGKTRLLDVVEERARVMGIPFHRYEFDPAAIEYTIALRFCRELLRELGEDAPPELVAVRDAFSGDVAPQGDTRYVLFDGVREGVRSVLEDGPRMLILDDMHLARPRGVELLAYILRNVIGPEKRPLLVVAASRPKANAAFDAIVAGEGGPPEAQQITVGTLSRSDLHTIVSSLVGDTVGARILAERLHAETEGNAFFVTEFLRSLLARRVITREGTGPGKLHLNPEQIATGHLEIPVGVRQMMKERLGSVDAGDRSVLEVLSVGGREIDLDVLLDVLEQEEEAVLDSLERMLAAGIIRERRAGELVFHSVSHRKFADVVYRDLPPDRRADLHRRMAAALELHHAHSPAALEVVGEHYRLAGDAGRAYRYLVAAAKRLSDRSLTQEAWDLTEKAGSLEDSARADLSPQDFQVFRRDNLTVRALAQYNRAEWSDAAKTWAAVLDLAERDGDFREATAARLQLALTLRRRGRNDDSRAAATRSLDDARKLHFREGVAEALHCLAALAWTEGDLDECERLANEGLLVARGGQLAAHRADLLLALTVAQATRGHLASATSGLTEAEGIFRELKRKRPRCLALANIAELLTWQGEPLQARQRAHVAVKLAEELNYKLGLAAAVRAMGVAALDLGLYEESHTALLEALQTAKSMDLPEEIVACHAPLTRLCLERGDATAARHYGARGLVVAERRDPERYVPLIHAHLARALAPTDPPGARTLMTGAERMLDDLPVPRRTQVLLALAYAWLSLDEPDRAREHARQVLHTAGSRGFRLLSLEARALMASLTDGEEHRTHKEVGQELVRDFTTGMSDDLLRAFARRPFIRFLEN